MKLLALSILATASTAAADDLVPVRFGTNWVAQAEHGGFYQAVADGIYADCGLAVEIVPGGPQVNNRAQLLAGNIDFFMGGDLLPLFNAAAEGIPFVAVAAIMQKHPQVIVTHPGVADSFDDLKDLTLFIADTSFQSYYQWLIAAKGFSEANRRPYTFNPAPFLADRRTGMQGYLTSEPYLIETTAGFAPDVWLLADQGYETYATTIETMRETIETRPDVVQCFVDGSIEGWKRYLTGENAAADALILKDNPEMTADKIAYAIAAMTENGIVVPAGQSADGIGRLDPDRVRAFYDQMVAAGVVPAGLPIEDHVTTRFVDTAER